MKTFPVPIFDEWTKAKEEDLVALERKVDTDGAIPLGDTDFGRLVSQRQHECMASVAGMDKDQIAVLEQLLADKKKEFIG